jgi:chromate transporter
MILIKLFLAFLRIGLFAIGGAYSFLPILEKELVEKYHWLSQEEFLDVLGIVKVFPGAISIKYATYTGFKVAKIPGVIVANIANFLGPSILIILASMVYIRYKNLPPVKNAFDMIQLAVFAMIIAVAFRLININQLFYVRNLLAIILAFGLFFYTKIHPALIIIGFGILGVALAIR